MSRGEPVAILLAGGQGTRIKHLFPDLPKPLVPAAGEPFLEWVIRHLARCGLRRMVVSLGCLAEVAERYLAARPADELTISSVREESPLGTGGAVRFAAAAAPDAAWYLATNGDSLVLADLSPLHELLAREDVDGAVVGLQVDDAARYGQLDVSPEGLLTGFREKQPGAGLINAGVYAFKPQLIAAFPAGEPLSLETQVFPALLSQGARLAVLQRSGPFLDIGTPQSVALAEAFIQQYFLQEAPA